MCVYLLGRVEGTAKLIIPIDAEKPMDRLLLQLSIGIGEKKTRKDSE